MKVRSKEEFVDFISKDRAWRKRELTNIKYLIERSKDGYVDLNLRAATLLLYSHWEGFVKHSTKVFFYYLSQSGIKYSRLNNNLIVSGVVKVLKETDGDDFALAKAINAFKFMSSDMLTESFKVNPDVHVNTKSNLNSEVFMEIAYKIGINGDFFESYIHIIDSVLLKNRNAIAHGENTSVSGDYNITVDSYVGLHGKVSELMDRFETELLNYVAVNGFLASDGQITQIEE